MLTLSSFDHRICSKARQSLVGGSVIDISSRTMTKGPLTDQIVVSLVQLLLLYTHRLSCRGGEIHGQARTHESR